MAFKGRELFVAEQLKRHFVNMGKISSFREGEDPPDIYLQIDKIETPVEITELDENSLNNRKTVGYGYLSFIDNLDKEFGSLISNDKRVFIAFYHYNIKVSKVSKQFKKFLGNLLKNKIEVNGEFEDCFGEVYFKVKILKSKKGCRKIIGSTTPFGMSCKKSRDVNIVSQYLSEFNLNEKSMDILMDRISEKNEKCKGITKPIWLALYDNYYNKFSDFECDEHKKHYESIASNIDNYGIFERVFVIFQNKDVLEIT